MEFDNYASSYSDDLKRSLPFGLRTIDYFIDHKIAVAKKTIEGAKSILDFGCGTGQCTSRLVRSFPSAVVTGFDVSEASVEIARNTVDGAKFTSEWIDIEVNQYDLIFVSNVFHHIKQDDRRLWLGRLKKSLNYGGVLLIFEHNPFNPLTRVVFSRCIFDRGATMIGRRQFARLAQDVGFDAPEVNYTLFFPAQLRSLTRFERIIRWLPFGAQYYLALRSS